MCTVAVLLAPLVVAADRRTTRAAAEAAERVPIVAKVPLFAGSSRPVLERLAAAMTAEALPAGQALIREGEPADALWVLAEGSLVVAASTRGTGDPIPDVSAPDVVGEIGVLRGIPRTATVTTRTACTLWRLGAADFLAAVEPERRSLALVGPVAARLARTHPDLADPTS